MARFTKMSMAAAATAALLLVPASGASAQTEGQTIAEIASADANFSTLVAALGAADLVGEFDDCSDGPYTVFAPTNDAFAVALSALDLTAEELLANTDLLISVLTYHVVSGAVDAATVVGLDSATTLNGKAIAIEVIDGGVVLNGTVNVVSTDITACNGIIHVIDGVLLPPSDDTTTTTVPTTASTAPTTVDAPPTLANTGPSDNAGMVILASTLLAGGLLLGGLSRRRDHA